MRVDDVGGMYCSPHHQFSSRREGAKRVSLMRQAIARPYPVFGFVGDFFGELTADEGREACPEVATGGGGDGPAVAAVIQGLYPVVHFQAQCMHFLWDPLSRGCSDQQRLMRAEK
jgi:hypothetical protein